MLSGMLLKQHIDYTHTFKFCYCVTEKNGKIGWALKKSKKGISGVKKDTKNGRPDHLSTIAYIIR